MLMITVMAFATDYKGQLDYILTTRNGDLTGPSYAQGTLKIEPYAGGKYTVTATGCDLSSVDKDLGDWGDIICEGVEGTTDANGVTTIDVAPYAFRGSDNAGFKSAKLFVKFKGDKAYATFAGTYNPNFFTNYTLKYTFGVDEGFDGGGSTGGGETGGETSSIVTVKENFQSTEGSSWGENVTIDWNTQKLVASINLASTGSDKGFLGVTKKGQTAGWNKYGIIFYNTNSSTVQGYAPGQPNNANTNQVTKGEDPVRFEISKDGGVKCQGNVVISAAHIAHLTNQSEIVVGAADKPAGALYNYIKVVPLNWTEVPPVTVDETFTYDQDAFVGPNDTKGTANVKVNKRTDGTYTMEITAPVATKVGVITVGEDTKGRTTYMGEVESSVVDGVKYVVNGVVYEEDGAKHLYMTLTHDDDTYIIGENPDAPKVVSTLPFENVAYTTSYNDSGKTTVTFTEMSDGTFPMTFVSEAIKAAAENLTKSTDTKGRTTYTGTAKRTDVTFDVTFTVKAVVYGEPAAQKLYMTMDNGSGFIVTVGDDPDYIAPVKCKNTLYVVENAKLLVETPKAEVVLQDKGDNKYDVTLPSFTAGDMTVPSITFEATMNEYKLTASNVSVPDVYSGDAAVVTMDGVFEAEDAFSALLTVKCGKWFDYEVGYGIKPFVATTQEFTAEWANVKVGDAEPVNFQNAKADYTEFAKGQYSLTFKDLTFGEKKIGDFTIKYVNKDEMDQLSTTASAGEWTRVETDQEVASKGDMPAISGFEGRLGGTGVLKVKFTIAVGGTTGNVAVDFGNKYEAPEPPVAPEVVDVVDADYNPAGQTWQKNDVSIDWDKQYIVAKLDLSTCKTGGAGPENVLAVGTDLTGWNNGPHYFFYYNKADKVLQYNYLHNANKSMNGGYANLSKAYIQLTDEVVTIEISKQGGLKVNGESALVKYIPSATNPSNNNTESWTTGDLETVFSGLWNLSSIGFGGCQGSTMSNATYKYVKVVPLGWTEPVTPPSVNDTKTFNEALYMVQGTTSYKIADSKVVVKEMSDETINMSLTYTIGDSNVEYTSTELTKGTDSKDRTTYTGHVSNGTQTFDVAGVVYEKDNVSRLYMTMTATNMNIVVGENPDAEVQKPVVYKNTLKVVRGTDTKTYEDAEVSVLAKGEGMYEVTLPKFSDMDNVPGELGPITFQAKGVEESGKVVLTATDQEFTLTNTGWKNDVVKVSMKGEIESEMLKATFNVNHSSMSGYNYTLYYGVEAPEVVTEVSNKTYKSNLRIADQTSEDENAYLFQTNEATVNIIKYSDKTYKITLKQITLNSKTSDLVFTGKAVESEVDPGEGGVVETEGTMVQATADAETQNFLGGAVNAQFMWQDVSDTEIRMSFVLEGKTLSLAGEFNYENTPTFPMENYQADGKGFVVSTDIDWSKQKFQAIIDATKCNAASTEDIFGFGAEATAWFKNIHVYADKGSYKAYFQPAAGEGNNNTTVTIADQSNITIEVSKAEGLTVDGVVVIAAEQLTGIFDLTTVKFGSGENSQYSNALYKSVKLVDLPKDPETGINAINAEVANGEAQLFTIDGVKLNKLQKGLNIVRTADGKVKKVLVK